MNKAWMRQIIDNLISLDTIVWVMLGFLACFGLFFIRPVFFNSNHVMAFPKYVPAINPIGTDLRQTLSYSYSWFINKNTPYIDGSFYPPFASVLFTPLIFLDFYTAYRLMTILTLVCFVATSVLIPVWILDKGYSSLLVFIFVTGLFSYGFQFELERGQFNAIAFLLCLLSVYIYHYQYRYRYAAYLLLSVAIQLKVYPAIFIVMFIRDWKDWKNNLRRLLAISALNLAALFVLGPQVFMEFLSAIASHILHPYVWIGNHSIKSFVSIVGMDRYAWLGQLMLLTVVGICLLLIILKAYIRQTSGLNPYLLLACTVAALLIPSVSHDYKLSILPAPIAILLISYRPDDKPWSRRIFTILLVLIFSMAYASTLFSFTNKPYILGNNLPALMVILVTVTMLSVFSPNLSNSIKIPKYE